MAQDVASLNRELILDAHASEEVDLSPEDLGRLKQILNGSTVRDMLKVAHRKVRRTHSALDPDIARRLAQASVSEEFYKLFHETISDAQFTLAKQRLIQKRYPPANCGLPGHGVTPVDRSR